MYVVRSGTLISWKFGSWPSENFSENLAATVALLNMERRWLGNPNTLNPKTLNPKPLNPK